MSLLTIIWNWAQGEGYTTLPWPAAGMEKSKCKKIEKLRRVKVLDVMWEAIRYEGDQTLKDCMGISDRPPACGRPDCVTVLLPKGDSLHLEAHKTGKLATPARPYSVFPAKLL